MAALTAFAAINVVLIAALWAVCRRLNLCTRYFVPAPRL